MESNLLFTIVFFVSKPTGFSQLKTGEHIIEIIPDSDGTKYRIILIMRTNHVPEPCTPDYNDTVTGLPQSKPSRPCQHKRQNVTDRED